MRIVASFLPPITSQPQLQQRGEQGKPENVREVFAELVDDNLSVPVKVVTGTDSVSQQVQLLRERVDLRLLREEASQSNELPLNNQRALATYQTISADPLALDGSITRLDIIV